MGVKDDRSRNIHADDGVVVVAGDVETGKKILGEKTSRKPKITFISKKKIGQN